MQQVAVVGQQQQARRLLVQPPDGRDGRVAPLPPIRQDVIDQRPVFLARTGHAQRLVQQHDQSLNRVQRLAVDLHPARQVGRHRDAFRHIGQVDAVQHDPARLAHPRHLGPRAIAHGAEQLVDARSRDLRHYFTASKIL
ncbi:hypothetical protein D3C85_1311800 [compost metagenome]